MCYSQFADWLTWNIRPCKQRKVKCDETNSNVPGGMGPCRACQRLGQQCDYRVRLNWEGRGKKVQDGYLNFSSSSISVGVGPVAAPPAPAPLQQMMVFTAGPIPAIPSSPQTEMPPQSTSSSQNSHSGASTMQATLPSPAIHAPNQTAHNPQAFLMQEEPLPRQPFLSDRSPSDMLAIDPALTGFQSPTASMFPSGRFGSYRTSQHTESWERRREDRPSTPKSAPLVSRSRPLPRPTEHFSPSNSGAPSPTASAYSTLSATIPGLDSPVSTPPPYPSRENMQTPDGGSFAYPVKRKHFGVRTQSGSAYGPSMPPPAATAHFSHQTQSPSNGYIDGRIASMSTPSTPGSSHSDDAFQNSYVQSSSYAAPDSGVRRMSVRSLLSDTPGIPHHPRSLPRSIPEVTQDMYHDCTAYGVDRGIKDLDIPNNDDMNALSGASPIAKRAHLALVTSPSNRMEFGFGMEEDNITFDTGGYYSNGPVNVSIPNILHPLPPGLLENPMLLLYFHHFLNHTAKCLIPHNCASNPFRTILPFMAMQDWNLLILILVYSMCHRARLLGQPEPTTRIALLVQGVFAGLRRALNDPSQIITNANLATAIMLASLEIVSPSAFGVTVPWQTHLDIARQMVSMRGGPKGMRTESRTDNVSSFLWSWFAYLDVLGSLSGGKDSPSSVGTAFSNGMKSEANFSRIGPLTITLRAIPTTKSTAFLDFPVNAFVYWPRSLHLPEYATVNASHKTTEIQLTGPPRRKI